MDRTRRWRRGAVMTLVGLFGGVLVGLGAPSPGAEAPAVRSLDPGLVRFTDWGPFSPNGDGRGDLARLVFRLDEPADVAMTVRLGGGVTERESLGYLGAGRHVWTWDGRRPRGGTVQDGSYDVAVRAARGAEIGHDNVYVDVQTESEGRLVTTRPIVHPRASAVEDHVQLMFVVAGWEPYADRGYWGIAQARARLRILDGRGRVVAERRVEHRYTPRFDWDGRDTRGHPVPAGRYVARLRTVDEAGNLLRLSAPLSVSDDDLVEEVWTAEFPAADVATYEPFYDGCNGCGDFCEPVASERYVSGLSFRPCTSQFFFGAARHFAADVPFATAPVDQYRIGLTGGPTTVGDIGTGRLVVGERAEVAVTGEGTTTSGWLAVDLAHQPNLATAHQPAVWYFSRGEGSYDVASFTIEYRHYVPAP